MSAFTSDKTDLNEALVELYQDDRDNDDTVLEDYEEEKRAALFGPSDPLYDADKGPSEAWWIANKEVSLHDSLSCRTATLAFEKGPMCSGTRIVFNDTSYLNTLPQWCPNRSLSGRIRLPNKMS